MANGEDHLREREAFEVSVGGSPAGRSTATHAPATPRLMRDIPALTGLRGVAALWVVVFHVGFASSQLDPRAVAWGQWPGLRSGYLAVDLFFVLSGFVLAMVHGQRMRQMDLRRTGAFFLERALRIGPLNAFMLLVFVLFVPLLRGTWLNTDPHDLPNLLSCLLLVQEWGHYPRAWNTPGWSLSAEAAAYLLFPVFVALASRVRSGAACVAMIACLLGIEACWVVELHAGMLDQSDRGGLVRCFIGFLSGVLACRAWRIRPVGVSVADGASVVATLLLVAAMAGAGRDALALPAALLIVMACANESRLCKRVFGNPLIHWLGRISFSLYLVHWLLIECAAHAIRKNGWSVQIALTFTLVAVLPASAVLYLGVERPCHRLGRNVAKRLFTAPP